MIWVLRFEILQVVSLHGLDICMVSCALCLCMANEDIDALLEEFRSTGGVLKQQERHDDVGCHLVQTACEEVLKGLVVLLFHVVEGILIEGDELADTFARA